IGLPDDTRAPVKLDIPAQILGALIMAALATAAIASGPSGWNSLPVGVSLAAAVLLGLVLLLRRARSHIATEKVSHGIRTAVASAGIMGFSFYGVLYFLSLHLQEQRGWSALHTGIALLPLTISSTIGPFIYGPLNRRWIAPVVLLGGFTSVLLGTVTLLAAGSSAPFWTEVVAMLLVGGASTLCFSALTTILVDAAPPEHMGKLSGWQNTSRQAGAMLATALVGSLIIGAPASHEIQATTMLVVVAAAGVSVAFIETRASRSAAGKTAPISARTG
ncbi:MAG: MFS transporter, partial [Mycobacterium sp.]|nr:MFS transporter [Mycobacterium sp.]